MKQCYRFREECRRLEQQGGVSAGRILESVRVKLSGQGLTWGNLILNGEPKEDDKRLGDA